MLTRTERLRRRMAEEGLAAGMAGAALRLAGKTACQALGPWRRPFVSAPVDLARIQTILLVKLYGIGNLILLTPALQTLRRDLPHARIILLSDGRALPVLEPAGYFDEALILPAPPSELYRNELTLALAWKLRRWRPDLILTSFPMGQPQLADLYDLLGARWSVGYEADGPPEKFSQRLAYDSGRHEVLCNLDLLRAIGLVNPVTALRVALSDRHREEARAFLARQSGGPPWFAFHCGSFPDMIAKRWSEERFAELGDRMVAGFAGRVLILGGPEERDLADRIRDRMKTPAINAAGALSLLGAAGLLEQCQVMVSNDSGLMHLAAAVGTPLVALFGPTSHLKNSPWTEKNRAVVVRSGENCSPCFRPGEPIRCSDALCMQAISVEQVWEAVEVVRGRS